MEQRDYLMKQVDMLGRVLGKILAGFFNLKNNGKILEGMTFANQALKNELNIDIDTIITIPNNEIINYFIKIKKFNEKHIEYLADLLFEFANIYLNDQDIEKAMKLYERVLTIYNHISLLESVYSFDRHNKISRIKNIIQ